MCTITIHTPTKALAESIAFYEKLNYTLVSAANPSILADESVIIEINPDRFARPGLKLYKDAWAAEVALLKEKTTIHKIDNGYLLNDLTGCWIYLMEQTFAFEKAKEGKEKATPGNFAGLSLEASDMEKSLEIWQLLGFKANSTAPNQSYTVLQNEEGFYVSLMKPLTCPHLFFNPSLTYFNGKDNLSIIEKIRAAAIPIAEEVTHFNKEGIVDNIIIRDPGGYGFFIFND